MCAICDDERQWVPRGGQQWTTLGELAKHYSVATFPMEPGLTGLIVEPETGIGQRAIVVEHPDGNVIWDPIGLITPAAISAVEQLGGVRWVAASHPHMYGVPVEWANAFDARVLVQRKDAEWVGRASERIELVDGTVELADSIWADVTWAYDGGVPSERNMYQLVHGDDGWRIAVLTPLAS